MILPQSEESGFCLCLCLQKPLSIITCCHITKKCWLIHSWLSFLSVSPYFLLNTHRRRSGLCPPDYYMDLSNGPQMGPLKSAWPPAWLNLRPLTEAWVLPLVASLRGRVTSQRPHIKCSLHLYRWAGSSIFWGCPLLPPTFSCSPGTLLLTQRLGSGATSSGRSPLTPISPSLLPAKFIRFTPTFTESLTEVSVNKNKVLSTCILHSWSNERNQLITR